MMVLWFIVVLPNPGALIRGNNVCKAFRSVTDLRDQSQARSLQPRSAFGKSHFVLQQRLSFHSSYFSFPQSSIAVDLILKREAKSQLDFGELENKDVSKAS
jgi:hypothetical protein